MNLSEKWKIMGILFITLKVEWLSHGKVMGKKDHRGPLIQDLLWLAWLAYPVDIFGILSMLNITLQGCGINLK